MLQGKIGIHHCCDGMTLGMEANHVAGRHGLGQWIGQLAHGQMDRNVRPIGSQKTWVGGRNRSEPRLANHVWFPMLSKNRKSIVCYLTLADKPMFLLISFVFIEPAVFVF